MKFNIKIILLIFTLLASACQTVKDGLSLQKRNNPDEFLVEKKNPLVLPPDFNELPIPDSEKRVQQNQNENEIRSLLSANKEVITKNENEIKSDDIEKSILDKINSR